MGVSQVMRAVCVHALMQVLLVPVGRGICGPMLHLWGPQPWRDDKWACPPSGVTSDPCQVPWWAWQEVKGEAMAVNEADYTSVIVRSVEPEERQRRCEVDVVVRRWCCSTHTGNEVSSCVGGVVEQSWWNCVHFGFVKAVWFLWDCLWASGGLPVASQHLIEKGGPFGTGWCCCECGLAPPFRLSFQSLENMKWTHPALAATPLWQG